MAGWRGALRPVNWAWCSNATNALPCNVLITPQRRWPPAAVAPEGPATLVSSTQGPPHWAAASGPPVINPNLLGVQPSEQLSSQDPSRSSQKFTQIEVFWATPAFQTWILWCFLPNYQLGFFYVRREKGRPRGRAGSAEHNRSSASLGDTAACVCTRTEVTSPHPHLHVAA